MGECRILGEKTTTFLMVREKPRVLESRKGSGMHKRLPDRLTWMKSTRELFIAVGKRCRGRGHVGLRLHRILPLGEQVRFQMKYGEQVHERSS